MIAAGEVVERPASVVKELMENAFDAGAKNIIVEVRNGGSTYIRVTDDGCGMSPDDVGISFIRHATSKLHDEFGLECIATMGFRGEALAAISSVSRMEIISRERGSEVGTQLILDAGEISEMGSFGCPEGTTVIVNDLFFNTPARLKFLKSDRSEASACINTAIRCALGHPEISVRFIRDGDEEFFSPGDGKLDSAMYSLLGRNETVCMLPCNSSADGISLSGYISSPSEGRGNRAHQFFYVNGRYIKSVLLQSALEQAYRNTLLSSRYPACVLFLNIPYGSVDVNVHPTKMEVRFGSEKTVFDLVYHSAKLAIESESRVDTLVEDIDFDHSEKAVSYETVHETKTGTDALHSPQAPYYNQLSLDFSNLSQNPQNSPVSSPQSPYLGKNVEKPVQNVKNSDISSYSIIGEAFKTYIIVEQNNELILIDKHAAHERMIFNRLKSQSRENSSQYLLSAMTIKLNPLDTEIVEQNGELLAELGFEIEPFGIGEFIVRAVPADMFDSDIGPAIEEIIEKIRGCSIPDPDSVKDEILHTVACKAAIKAGWLTQKAELDVLVKSVLSGEILYCPHGRPVSVPVTRKDLDRLFKRIL